MIILTGFGPFGKLNTNLSGELVKSFPDFFEGESFLKKIFPVSWKLSIREYKQTILDLDKSPTLVILLGVQPKDKVCLEKRALNWALGKDIDSRLKFGFIKYKNPMSLKSNLPLKKVQGVVCKQFEIFVSNNAGVYLCNYIFYWALYFSQNTYPVQFIHIPSNGTVEEYSIKVKEILRAILEII